jgi:uncharacterized protein YebE (UPF0316 family)
MCPEIIGLTCYVGDYNNILNVLMYAVFSGFMLGIMVAIVNLSINNK